MSETVAIVGAGLAGLVCARALQEAGHAVVLFDKGRRPGGRLSSRRTDTATFDHGAPLFTASSADFEAVVQGWADAGIVARWPGRFASVGAGGGVSTWSVDPWVGVPTMSALPRALAEGLDVRTSIRVGAVVRDDARWRLDDEQGEPLMQASTVLINTPAGQATPLLGGSLGAAADDANNSMHPCWTVMFMPPETWDPGWDAATFEAGPLSRAFRQASKPGRPDAAAWVLHATGAWTREHWEDAPEAVIEALLAAAGAPSETAYVNAHRWRYARADAGVAGACLWDAASRIGACGDWCGGPGLEGAWRSGRALARRVLE